VGNLDVYQNMPDVLSAVLAALEQQLRAEDPSSAPPGHLLPVRTGRRE
jgi:hypothetical protein